MDGSFWLSPGHDSARTWQFFTEHTRSWLYRRCVHADAKRKTADSSPPQSSPQTHPCRSAAGSASCGNRQRTPNWCACRLHKAFREGVPTGNKCTRRLNVGPSARRPSSACAHDRAPKAPSPACDCPSPMASISSMKMMQGAFFLAAANRERTRREPTPTNISSNSEPALQWSRCPGSRRAPVTLAATCGPSRKQGASWPLAPSLNCGPAGGASSLCLGHFGLPARCAWHSLVEEGHARLARHRARQQCLARACRGWHG